VFRGVRRRSGSFLVAAFVLAAVFAPSAFAQDQAPGSVGGPPTDSQSYEELRPLKPQSEVLVIGAARTVAGPVELVAFDSNYGLCVFVDRRGGSSGGCGESLLTEDQSIAMEGWGYSGPNRRVSYVTGFVSTSVARVYASARHPDGLRRTSPLLAQVDAALASRLGQEEPFGYVAVFAKGCISSPRFRVAALDSAGQSLGSSRGVRFGRGSGCGNVELPTVEGIPQRPSRLAW
jgi:hypothetical protein